MDFSHIKLSGCILLCSNIINKCSTPPGRDLMKSAFCQCQCHTTYVYLCEGITKLLNFDWFSVTALLILVH